jgi:two-component sensor histidine kinase
MDALKNSNPETVALEDQIEDLRNTWDGIVELKCEIPKPLAKAINSSRDSVIVFNELLKEIVSNSVRHGQASKVEVTLEQVAPGEVNLIAINNGTKPKKSTSSSIGTTVFNSLCLKSQLSWNKETKRAEFVALVPIA